ncbi:P-loop containing nucleoside triphosphate hydrolase protein, partial [Cylindrobasidium torrendii FP15055 ss-10]
HLNIVLVVPMAIHTMRDLMPLATFSSSPMDANILWAEIAFLALSSVVIPGLTPREHVPLDASDQAPSPEQTASLFSGLVFGWVDGLVRTASQASSIAIDALPPLSDISGSRYLKGAFMARLDPFSGATRRHIFWNLLRIFSGKLLLPVLFLNLHAVSNFIAPLGLKNLLQYIETRGEGATYRPWFWIASLFFGPTISVITWDGFLHATVRIRQQALITQLILEHSLRLRVKADVKGESKRKNLLGKISNLVTTDVFNASDAGLVHAMIPIEWPVSMICALALLYNILGWSAFVGVAVIISAIPVVKIFANAIATIAENTMTRGDARIQRIVELTNIIRMVKLLGWEKEMEARIASSREEELIWIKKRQFYILLSSSIQVLVTFFTMLATFFTYTIILKHQLSASIVFSSMAIFDILAQEWQRLEYGIEWMPVVKNNLDRLNAFLEETELLDEYTNQEHGGNLEHPGKIGFSKASFSWSRLEDEIVGIEAPITNFKLQVDELVFPANKVTIITGPTGSGKTSLLMALLGECQHDAGEMHFLPMTENSWYNLPRDGGVAFAPQESWVINATIKASPLDNILFGLPFKGPRYRDVLHQCALEHDIELFQGKDETEVGEKGITLSGGQKARLTLARAIYSAADILILDDVFAALDAHTSKWIVEKCFQGPLVQGRTVIMVSHNLPLLTPIAEHMVIVENGRIIKQESFSRDYNSVSGFASSTNQDLHIDRPEDIIGASDESSGGKLIEAEETLTGKLTWGTISVYLYAMFGRSPMLFILGSVGGQLMQKVTITAQTWYLGYWAAQYDDPTRMNSVLALSYIGGYGLFIAANYLFLVSSSTVFIVGAIRASRTIHQRLLGSILAATWRWLDITPVSRIITRCSQDIRVVDEAIGSVVRRLTNITLNMLVKAAAVIALSPAFLVPSLVVAAFGVWVGNIFLSASLPVKRQHANAKAPVVAHIGTAIAGLTSIRAYGAQAAFIEQAHVLQDRYSRAYGAMLSLNRWVDIRIEVAGSLFATLLAVYLVYFKEMSASNTGFSLSMAIGFTDLIFMWVRSFNELQLQANSIERLASYLDIEHEAEPTPAGIPPAFWPASGSLEVKNLSAKYSENGPHALDNISFSVLTGERIGIVGRTGSGKSSLALSLLRCILTEGEVLYDGLPISSINLDILRAKITIIPQVPELVSGTLRYNLDPFEEHDDAALNDALRSSGFFALQEAGEHRLSLDSDIADTGGNLSLGERQIVVLARGLLRASKLLILDEASSAIDYRTDAIIQQSLRTVTMEGRTLLTIAHRLQTVMDFDRILVLDAGHVAEFDTPQALLAKKDGILKALVEESPNKEQLYGMVNA